MMPPAGSSRLTLALLAGLLTVVLVALPALDRSWDAHAQGKVAEGKVAEPGVQVPGFWDPRRRPERPDLTRLTTIRFLTETDYPPFNFAGPDGNPQGFMLRAPLIYHVYYDKGWRDYKPTGPTSGVMTTYEAETYSAADCMTVMGWYKQALKMCGARSVDMVEDACRARGGDCCRYVVNWS